MFRSDYISTLLTGLVGWRQPSISGLPTLSDANKETRSGLYFEDAHPIASIKNLYYTQENDAITAEQFNTFLISTQKQAILRVLNQVFASRAHHIDTVTLFPFESSRKDLLAQTGRFVGYRINVIQSRRRAINIDSVRMLFNKNASLTLYLFNSQVALPIESKACTIVANTETVVDLNWVMAAASEKYSGGTFYLGYFDDSVLDLQSYKRNFELSNIMQSTCGMNISPVELDGTAIALDSTTYRLTSECYGLNFDFSVYNDYTDLIRKQSSKFATAIQLAGSASVLEVIMNSTRTNPPERIASNVASKAFAALNGVKTETGVQQVGLFGRLSDQVKTLQNAIFPTPMISKITLR